MSRYYLIMDKEELGLIPIETYGPKEAIEIFRTEEVDMIMMDLMMPENDGITAIRTIRQLDEWHEIPLVLITAADLSEDEIKNIKDENCHLMRKPVIYNDLVKMLINMLSAESMV